MNPVKPFFVFCAFIVICSYGFAQSQDAAVRLTVEKMFEAMRSSDTILLKQVVATDAILQTVVSPGNAATDILLQSVASFIEAVGKGKPGDADERIRFEAVHIDGALASVWTSYRFYYKGKFSHCGVNSFQLVLKEGAWKIQHIIDTRRKDNCIW